MRKDRSELFSDLALFITSQVADNHGDPECLMRPNVMAYLVEMVEDHNFIYADNHAIPLSTVVYLDFDDIDIGIVRINTIYDETYTASGFDAYRIVIERAPTNMEGRRLKWVKHAWAFHNLVAHPLLQLCAWIGLPKLGMRIHDWTQPIPLDVRKDLTHY